MAAEQNLTLPRIQLNARSSLPDIQKSTKSQVRFSESFGGIGGWTTFEGTKKSQQVNQSGELSGTKVIPEPLSGTRRNNNSIIKIVEINPEKRRSSMNLEAPETSLVDQL